MRCRRVVTTGWQALVNNVVARFAAGPLVEPTWRVMSPLGATQYRAVCQEAMLVRLAALEVWSCSQGPPGFAAGDRAAAQARAGNLTDFKGLHGQRRACFNPHL